MLVPQRFLNEVGETIGLQAGGAGVDLVVPVEEGSAEPKAPIGHHFFLTGSPASRVCDAPGIAQKQRPPRLRRQLLEHAQVERVEDVHADGLEARAEGRVKEGVSVQARGLIPRGSC